MASAGPLSLRSNCDMAAAARRKPALTTWLDSTIVPVFVVDSRRRIVFFNHGCEQLTGWTRDLVLGRVCDYASGDDHTRVETLTSSLCPPSEVFAGRALTTPLAVIDRSGESHSRFLHYIPLIDDDQHVDRAAGLITRIDHPIRLAEPSMSQRLHAELAAARASLRSRYDVRSLVCRSDAMNRVAEQIALAVPSLVPVCLAGESGTGREHVARVIHGQSETGDRAFVPLDCSAMCAFELEQSLRRLRADLEETSRPGHLQAGTLFFRSVDSMPRDVQRLVLDWFDRENTASTGVRLVSSATGDLRKAMADDSMIPPFFYLLTPLVVLLPPLRHRMEDLDQLAQHFLEELNRGDERQVDGFAGAVLEQFHDYNWPGNLRELQQVVSEARLACDGDSIQVVNLPFRFRTGVDAQSLGPAPRVEIEPLEELLARVERDHLQRAMQQARGNRSHAAKLLGLTRARLYRRLQAHGMDARP